MSAQNLTTWAKDATYLLNKDTRLSDALKKIIGVQDIHRGICEGQWPHLNAMFEKRYSSITLHSGAGLIDLCRPSVKADELGIRLRTVCDQSKILSFPTAEIDDVTRLCKLKKAC